MSNAVRLPPMEEIIANSFKDYHVKGFDYLCLQRTEALTTKIYLFQGDVSQLPEVVNPHDHRYDFHTTCLSGEVANFTFDLVDHPTSDRVMVLQHFEFRTPLNGGNGFTWIGEKALQRRNAFTYRPSEYVYQLDGKVVDANAYWSPAEALHTIRIGGSETVLMLQQCRDVVPLDVPTSTFTRDREPPSLSGLYNRFTPDEIVDRLRKLERLTGVVYTIGD